MTKGFEQLEHLRLGESVRVTVRPNEGGVLDLVGSAAVVFVRQEGDGAWVNYTGIPNHLPAALGVMLEWMSAGPGFGIGLIAATVKPEGAQAILNDIERSLHTLSTVYQKDPAHAERYVRTLERIGRRASRFRRTFLE